MSRVKLWAFSIVVIMLAFAPSIMSQEDQERLEIRMYSHKITSDGIVIDCVLSNNVPSDFPSVLSYTAIYPLDRKYHSDPEVISMDMIKGVVLDGGQRLNFTLPFHLKNEEANSYECHIKGFSDDGIEVLYFSFIIHTENYFKYERAYIESLGGQVPKKLDYVKYLGRDKNRIYYHLWTDKECRVEVKLTSHDAKSDAWGRDDSPTQDHMIGIDVVLGKTYDLSARTIGVKDEEGNDKDLLHITNKDKFEVRDKLGGLVFNELEPIEISYTPKVDPGYESVSICFVPSITGYAQVDYWLHGSGSNEIKHFSEITKMLYGKQGAMCKIVAGESYTITVPGLISGKEYKFNLILADDNGRQRIVTRDEKFTVKITPEPFSFGEMFTVNMSPLYIKLNWKANNKWVKEAMMKVRYRDRETVYIKGDVDDDKITCSAEVPYDILLALVGLLPKNENIVDSGTNAGGNNIVANDVTASADGNILEAPLSIEAVMVYESQFGKGTKSRMIQLKYTVPTQDEINKVRNSKLGGTILRDLVYAMQDARSNGSKVQRFINYGLSALVGAIF